MLRKLILTLGFTLMACPSLAQENSSSDDSKDDEQSSERLTESDRDDALDFSQKELQGRFQTGAGVDLGLVMPWSKIGASYLGKIGSQIASLSLGFGSYEFSGNLDRRNYKVSGDTQAAYVASRYFVMGFGPIYLEPIVGLVHWNGEVKPRGADDIADSPASSLSSRYDLYGVEVGANLGLMWIFSNGIFLDYNFMNLSKAILLKETYTTSTEDARKATRAQVAGPVSMNSVNLRVGYAIDF